MTQKVIEDDLKEIYNQYLLAKQRGMPSANRLLAEYLGMLNDRQASEMA